MEIGFGTQREIEAFCADGIGAALGVSFTAGQQLIDTACFTAVVPLAAAALATGRMDLARVKVLARELGPVRYDTEEERTFVDGQVAGHEDLTPKKLQAKVREAVMARSPEEAAEVRRREEKRRGVWLFRQPAGMASLTFRLRADEAELAYQALNAAAWHRHDQSLADSGRNCEPGEFRPFDNFRADAFMAEMRETQLRYLQRQPEPDGESADPTDSAASAAAPAEPTESGTSDPATCPSEPDQTAASSPATSRRAARMMDPARVMLHLYMDAATLVGLQNRPATLLGYGPIDADLAREIAQDAAVVRLLTDPFTGQVQAIDLPAYRVPKILRWAVQARDRSCAFPGCDVPAYDNQLDHINPHPFARKLRKAFATGSTSFANLHSLCLRHHYLKTHGGWTIQTTSGSRLEWISPTGHSYRRNPEWGPPAGFWKDHHSGLPIDAPPGARPSTDVAAPVKCPF